LNYLEFFESLKRNEIKALYVFEGEEEYIKEQAVKALCAKLLPEGLEQMNCTELTNPAPDELIAAVETMPMMTDKRVVLVRDYTPLNAGKAAASGDAEQMLTYLPTASPSTCLVFWVRGKADGRKKLYTYCKKQKAVVDFSPMNDQQAIKWIAQTLKALGKRIDQTTAERFLFTVGNDAALLKQEMEKLADYTGDREAVTKDDIQTISVQSLESTVFQMVDAQVAGNYGKALVLMQRVLESGNDRMLIMAMLLRQYRMLYQIRCLMTERVQTSELPSLLKIPPFAARRMQEQARRYNIEKLKTVYEYLLDYEYRLKSGKTPQEGCAEAALMQMKELLAG